MADLTRARPAIQESNAANPDAQAASSGNAEVSQAGEPRLEPAAAADVQEPATSAAAQLKKDWQTKEFSITLNKIATGETWFGPDALERNMADPLDTSETLPRHS